MHNSDLGPLTIISKLDYVYKVLPFVMLCGLPLFIPTLMTIRQIKATKVHHRMHADMQYLPSHPDSNVTFALVIAVVVFIICKADSHLFCDAALPDWWVF